MGNGNGSGNGARGCALGATAAQLRDQGGLARDRWTRAQLRSGFGAQRGLRECIELCDCGACDTEDLPTAAAEGDPGFECGNTLRAQAFEQRKR